MIIHETLSTTDSTRGEGLCVRATLGGSGCTFLTMLEIKDGLLADSVDGDWPGLVVARLTLNNGQNTDKGHEDHNIHQGVATGLVETEHLLYVYIFFKVR